MLPNDGWVYAAGGFTSTSRDGYNPPMIWECRFKGRRLILAAMMLLMALVLSVAAPRPALTDGDDDLGPASKPNLVCDKLESVLAQLMQAPDPEEFAAGMSLAMTAPGQIRVVIVMSSDVAAPFDPPVIFQAEARYANLVRGTGAISDLCSLAAAPGVARVRPALARQVAR
jgi:hypothetical protein